MGYPSGMIRADQEIAEILRFIREELVRMKHTDRGLLSTFAEKAEVGTDVLSKFQTYENDSEPYFRTTYKILRGLLGVPPIMLKTETDYLPVPLVEGRIAAHPAGSIPGDAVESVLYFPRSQMGGRRDLVAVRLAPGADSMEPTLHPGDLVIIDRDDKHITPRGLYAVRLPDLESCTVKRLQPLPEQKLILLISDNPAYPPEAVPWSDQLLIGRVFCSWTNWLKYSGGECHV